MNEVTIEVIAPAGEDEIKVHNVATRMPDLWMMNVDVGGAAATLRRVNVRNPKTKEMVECLQIETAAGTMLVVPVQYQADFARKRRSGGGRKPKTPPVERGSYEHPAASDGPKGALADRRTRAVTNGMAAMAGADAQMANEAKTSSFFARR